MSRRVLLRRAVDPEIRSPLRGEKEQLKHWQAQRAPPAALGADQLPLATGGPQVRCRPESCYLLASLYMSSPILTYFGSGSPRLLLIVPSGRTKAWVRATTTSLLPRDSRYLAVSLTVPAGCWYSGAGWLRRVTVTSMF